MRGVGRNCASTYPERKGEGRKTDKSYRAGNSPRLASHARMAAISPAATDQPERRSGEPSWLRREAAGSTTEKMAPLG